MKNYTTDDSPIPIGLCQCGCGRETNICQHTDNRTGCVEGQPYRYILGHARRLRFPEDFWARVDKRGPDECWNWQGQITEGGYGRFSGMGSDFGDEAAHRISYRLEYGSIPDGLHIDHLCRNRRCQNPKHLEAVTPGENNRRGVVAYIAERGENICPNGHELTPENSYFVKGTKYPRCRQCARESKARYDERKRIKKASLPKPRDPRIKLTPQQAVECQKLHDAGWSNEKIGKLYGVSHMCISKIIRFPEKYK